MLGLMPPEPLPCDRKDFFKERKHERPTTSEFSSSSSLGPGVPPCRWRDSTSSTSSGYYNSNGSGNNVRDLSRWGHHSHDFRSRPPGHGKQGGWHMFEEPGHGYSFPRSTEKMIDDDNFRGSNSKDGKYARSNRENRGPSSQREWRGNPWDTSNGHSHILSRQNGAIKDQKPIDDVNGLGPSNRFQPDFASTGGEHHLKSYTENGKIGIPNGLITGQRDSSLNWKTGSKWTRSGSMSSRGTNHIHASSPKPLAGVERVDVKVEPLQRNVCPLPSPSDDPVTSVCSAANSEETRKKPRLGWGEGLAKYEKKKVPEIVSSKDEKLFSSSTGELNSQSSSLAERSPLVARIDCGSPATPSSVACSSSPDAEDKRCGKAVMSCTSPNVVSQLCSHLEKLDDSSVSTLGSSLLAVTQSNDLQSVDSLSVRTTALNKLLEIKSEISKKLEVTEIEIDALETELKSLKMKIETRPSVPCVSYALLSEENGEHLAASKSLDTIANSEDKREENMISCDRLFLNAKDKDAELGSPETASSKFIELEPVAGSISLTNELTHAGAIDANSSIHMDHECLEKNFDIRRHTQETVTDDTDEKECKFDMHTSSKEDNLCRQVLASNQESACRAADAFDLLMHKDQSPVDINSFGESPAQPEQLLKDRFAARTRLLQFQERAIALKYRAFQQLWKEDMHLSSLRKVRAKSQKKFELGLRTHGVHQKHRSIRSRLASQGVSCSARTTDILDITSKLMSEPMVKPYRCNLKMPALILDEKEKKSSCFISSNGLVEDPCAVEKERNLINPWSPQERMLFIEKLALFGKDFHKIASFIDHKTTADCVEFYYKNHKSEDFAKIKKKKHVKTNADYLVGSGKRWNASLDVLGAASAFAADAENSSRTRQSFTGRIFLRGCTVSRKSRGDDDLAKRRSIDFGNDRETAAADVLAGICGSLSCEPMSSCVTMSMDVGEGCWEQKSQKVDGAVKWGSASDITQNADEDTCSDDSCGEVDPTDWNDEEKSKFIQALSTYGKDFVMISRCVGTKSREKCKVFFSKAKKCLGLDQVHPERRDLAKSVINHDFNWRGSDVDALETDLITRAGRLEVKQSQDEEATDRVDVSSDLNELANVSGSLDERNSELSDPRPQLTCGDDRKTNTDSLQQSESSRLLFQPCCVEAACNKIPEDGVPVAESTSVERHDRIRDLKLFGQILCDPCDNAESGCNSTKVVDHPDAEGTTNLQKYPKPAVSFTHLQTREKTSCNGYIDNQVYLHDGPKVRPRLTTDLVQQYQDQKQWRNGCAMVGNGIVGAPCVVIDPIVSIKRADQLNGQTSNGPWRGKGGIGR